jgi:hypothetical protein
VADHGLTGERTDPKGQFVVNFADATKAGKLRHAQRMPDSVKLTGGNSTLDSGNIRLVTFRPNRVRS